MGNRVAIIGGALDPIHNGHIAMAEATIRHGYDEVWFMPCYQSMFGKEMTPAYHRLMMCHAAAMGCNDKIKVCDWEIRHKFIGGTIDFWNKFIRPFEIAAVNTTLLHPEFTFVIGMDNALCIDKWKDSKELLELARFLVIARPGYQAPDNAWFIKWPHDYLHVETPDISSSQIRKGNARALAVSGSESIEWFMDKLGKQVPLNVMGYIHAYDLYQR